MAPPASGLAALQYMCDMRHTALGTLLFRPPLGRADLKNKVALVTGGTSGIGLAAARALANAGAVVHITGRNAERGAAASSSVTAGDGRIIFHELDQSTSSAAERLSETITGVLDGQKLDLLVQNLAVMPDSFETVEGGHERTLSTNLLSFYKLGTSLLPTMARDGRVINVVSAGMHLHKLKLSELKALDHAGAGFDPIYACARARETLHGCPRCLGARLPTCALLCSLRLVARVRPPQTARPTGHACCLRSDGRGTTRTFSSPRCIPDGWTRLACETRRRWRGFTS